MPQFGKPGWPGTGDPAVPDSAELETLQGTSGADVIHLFDYCRALLGQDAEAASTARSVLESARGLLPARDHLRPLIFALARRHALALRPLSCDESFYRPLALTATANRQADNGVLRAFRALTDHDREILDLVYRHDIRAANLPEVLGIPAAEAYRRLAVAEGEFVSLVAEPPGSDAGPAASADAKPEDLAALPLAALPVAALQPATRLLPGEPPSHRRPARLAATAVISAATLGAVVYIGAASHPAGPHAATLQGNGASHAGKRAGTPSTAHAGRSAPATHRSASGQPGYVWMPVASRTATPTPPVASNPSSATAASPSAANAGPPPPSPKPKPSPPPPPSPP